jgi:hypothetical protein
VQVKGALLLGPVMTFPEVPVLVKVKVEFKQIVVADTLKLAEGTADTVIGETTLDVVPHAFEAITVA